LCSRIVDGSRRKAALLSWRAAVSSRRASEPAYFLEEQLSPKYEALPLLASSVPGRSRRLRENDEPRYAKSEPRSLEASRLYLRSERRVMERERRGREQPFPRRRDALPLESHPRTGGELEGSVRAPLEHD
jgi:hypothetical protein